MAEGRRRSFGPVVLLGLAASGLAATAAARPWVAFPGEAAQQSLPGIPATDPSTTYPLASALSLVLLASWGVLLVTRGRVRRGFAGIAALSALALAGAVVAAAATLPGSAVDATSRLLGRAEQDPGFTGWFWTAAAATVVALVASVLAVRWAPAWPEMGSRYDAPVGPDEAPRATRAPEAPASERELWQQLDAGHDPTDPSS